MGARRSRGRADARTQTADCRRNHAGLCGVWMPDLTQALRTAAASHDTKFYKRLAKFDLIIIDEFGYPPRDPDTIQLFFDFITDHCYEKKSLILTSNRTIKEWLSDFTDPRDEKMAHTAIDRLAQDTLLFTFLGESHRVLHSKLTDPLV
ncbi:MAG: ATP-binding protein [Bacillus sp. (in: firmicutes)]